MSNDEAMIEEYRQLREELRMHLGHRTVYGVLLTAISVAAGLSITFKDPVPLLLMSPFPIFLILEQTRRLDAVSRIATYIKIYIEARVEDLNWETYGMKLMAKRSPFSLAGQAFDAIGMAFLVIVQYVIAVVIWFNHTENLVIGEKYGWLIYPIGLLLLIGLTLSLLLRYRSMKRRTTYIKEWKEVGFH